MKRVLVTGANKGIGLAVVERLLTERPEVHVLLGSRDAKRGEAARLALVGKNGSWASRVEVVELDVASEASVAAAAGRVAPPLHGLVNNAGVYETGSAAETLRVNVLGVKAVCDAFCPLLAADGRVVNVSSGAASMFLQQCSPAKRAFFTQPGSSLSWAALEAEMAAFLGAAGAADPGRALAASGYAPLGDGGVVSAAYGFSKALLNCYTALLAAQGVLVNACSPGFIATDLVRSMAARLGRSPEAMGAVGVEQSTVAVFKLLLGELPEESRGWYWGSDGKRSPLDRYRSPGSPEWDGR